MWDFLTGTGDEWTVHGPDSPLTQQLMRSRGVVGARRRFLRAQGQQVSGVVVWGAFPSDRRLSLMNVPVFGDASIWTTSLAEHFVGSYDYLVIPVGSNLAEFHLYDTKSAWSLFAHRGGRWPRLHLPFILQVPTPLGITYQEYWWRESPGR
jgi:hypothetical protein